MLRNLDSQDLRQMEQKRRRPRVLGYPTTRPAFAQVAGRQGGRPSNVSPFRLRSSLVQILRVCGYSGG